VRASQRLRIIGGDFIGGNEVFHIEGLEGTGAICNSNTAACDLWISGNFLARIPSVQGLPVAIYASTGLSGTFLLRDNWFEQGSGHATNDRGSFQHKCWHDNNNCKNWDGWGACDGIDFSRPTSCWY
jgi:hypothetical protein